MAYFHKCFVVVLILTVMDLGRVMELVFKTEPVNSLSDSCICVPVRCNPVDLSHLPLQFEVLCQISLKISGISVQCS